MWVLSQLLLLIYFWLDNGSNTCGINFHFENNENAETEEEVQAEEEPEEEREHVRHIDDQILKKLHVSDTSCLYGKFLGDFKTGSVKGR